MSARDNGSFILLGHNIGIDHDVSVRTRAPTVLHDLTIEQALKCIDSFMEPGRTRILLALPCHYTVPVTAFAGVAP